MCIARAFDTTDATGRAFARRAVAIAKYWLTGRCPAFVDECMECLGGGGYIEESPLPRLFRESPLNGIWEGSGNVIALDILRTLNREHEALAAYVEEIALARGGDARLDRAAGALIDRLQAAPIESDARAIVERLALLLERKSTRLKPLH